MDVESKEEEERPAEKDKLIEGDIVFEELDEDWRSEYQHEKSSEEWRDIWQHFQLVQVGGDLSEADAAAREES